MKDWEIIEKAADIAEEKGVCSQTLENVFGQVCSEGALLHALYGAEWRDFLAGHGLHWRNAPEMVAISDRICKVLNLPVPGEFKGSISPPQYVAQWNDLCQEMVDGVPEWMYEEMSEERIKLLQKRYENYEHKNVLDGLRYAAKAVRLEDGD